MSSMRGDPQTRKHWSMFITERSEEGGLIWIFPSDPPMFPREQRVYASKEILDQVKQGEVQKLYPAIEQVWSICGFYAKPRKFILFLEQFQPDLERWKKLFEKRGPAKLLQGARDRLGEMSSQYSLKEIKAEWSITNPLQEWQEGTKVALQKMKEGLIIGVSEWREIKDGGLFYWRYPDLLQRIREPSKSSKITNNFWREETQERINLVSIFMGETGLEVQELISVSRPKRGNLFFRYQEAGENYIFRYSDSESPYHIHYYLVNSQGILIEKWENLGKGDCTITEDGICSLNEVVAEEGKNIQFCDLVLRDKNTGRIIARSEERSYKKSLTLQDHFRPISDALCCTAPRRGKWRLWFREGGQIIGKTLDPSEYSYPSPPSSTESNLHPDARLHWGGGREIDVLVSYDHIQPWYCTILNTKTAQRAIPVEWMQKPETFSICYGEDGVWVLVELQLAYIRPGEQEINWLKLPRAMECVSVSSDNRLLLVSSDDARYHILAEEERILGEFRDSLVWTVENTFFVIAAEKWATVRGEDEPIS